MGIGQLCFQSILMSAFRPEMSPQCHGIYSTPRRPLRWRPLVPLAAVPVCSACQRPDTVAVSCFPARSVPRYKRCHSPHNRIAIESARPRHNPATRIEVSIRWPELRQSRASFGRLFRRRCSSALAHGRSRCAEPPGHTDFPQQADSVPVASHRPGHHLRCQPAQIRSRRSKCDTWRLASRMGQTRLPYKHVRRPEILALGSMASRELLPSPEAHRRAQSASRNA